MTSPRRVLPGQTLSITRRCTDRRYYLKPIGALNEALRYVIAEGCERFGMELHAVCVMFNHVHLVVTDRHGHFPLFNQVVFRNMTRVVKHFRPQIEGAVFDKRPAGVTALLSPEAVAQQMAYVAANPVSAGLVASHRHYPGVVGIADGSENAPAEVLRPSDVLRTLPRKACWRLSPWRPHQRGLRTKERTQQTHHVHSLATRLVSEMTTAARIERRGVPSRRRLLATSPLAKPRTRARWSSIVPALAASNRDLLRRAKRALRLWRRAYREAREALKAGREAVFPIGTWALPRQVQALVTPFKRGTCPIACSLVDA